ncbi:aliphatic sulfonate ABC transporter substrate-binding protein [Brevibacillus fluminis]|uniref:Aliphatic sulfonate ABC transporter substrate-binding protein n=1 Tax=Brevibacillus fluminis TaxID=511487 RepID=A0A3M8DD31_9BACL|nr:aliphatic sulfonate ABC transporter substrate-binding protein [Brevibacillus fluminis]RNB85107.1 aliphatic sulfonate ABC transporter substrate-binding protein [Brevibacillus fluminis]
MKKIHGVRAWLAGLLTVLTLTGCANYSQEPKPTDTVRFGYFPNVTHMAAIVGLDKGYFQEELGPGIKLAPKTFPNGGLFMEAISTGQIDFGYTGPGPALINYLKNPTHHILAGAVDGGAVLVVRPDSGITSVKDLDGKRVAIPGIGNTQDLALRKVLKEAGLGIKGFGGTVEVLAQSPADMATLFLQQNVDAAAVPEPWGVNLQKKAGAKILLDWDRFGWGKETTNTVVLATKSFTDGNPELTKKLLRAHVRAVQFIKEHPDEAVAILVKQLKALTGKDMNVEEIKAAVARSNATYDVHENVLREMAKISEEAGYSTKADISGFIDLSYLKQVTGK